MTNGAFVTLDIFTFFSIPRVVVVFCPNSKSSTLKVLDRCILACSMYVVRQMVGSSSGHIYCARAATTEFAEIEIFESVKMGQGTSVQSGGTVYLKND